MTDVDKTAVDKIDFTFADTIAGYVVSYDDEQDAFVLRTSDGREFTVSFTVNTFALGVRNFGEAYVDRTGQMRDMLSPGRLVFAYGVFYSEGEGHRFEVKQLVFPSGNRDEDFTFEQPDWWVNQARAIADFYLRGQFPDGNYDWNNYRTKLTLSGTHTPDYVSPDYRQETDTISRLIYGLASTYLLTGEDRFLAAAEAGVEYLRDNLQGQREEEGVVFWYHAMDRTATGERKIYSSEFGDDYDAIPMYEQIYALAGPTQTFRITGDPRILDDIDRTVKLFDHFFKDRELGGYFSHVDPVTLNPREGSLGHNRARKNWNSVGDHAPAYLINAVLATGREDLLEFLVDTGDTIVARFPDDEHSPFVQERFHEDWRADRHWGWQQDNAVVGHNLKIAWNLMRINNRRPNQEYVDLANKIARVMPAVGSDQQRGGWYDVVERTIAPGRERHRFVWHDRKAWWQQEQAILAYLILAGVEGDPEHRRLARESAAYYNAFFLDHDDGGVYFNVLNNGIPYLVGNERLKGSHSMSGYHSIELCYLSQVYINLLQTQQPLFLHFKPRANAFADGLLRVAPDLLPEGSIRLEQVWVDDEPWTDFDADALTVTLPPDREVRVRVQIVAAAERLEVSYENAGGRALVTINGVLDSDGLPKLRRTMEQVLADNPSRVVLMVENLTSISSDAMNEVLFFRSKTDIGTSVYVVGANEQVAGAFKGVDHQVASGGEFLHLSNVAEVPAG